jgi:hypothetical protein
MSSAELKMQPTLYFQEQKTGKRRGGDRKRKSKDKVENVKWKRLMK